MFDRDEITGFLSIYYILTIIWLIVAIIHPEFSWVYPVIFLAAPPAITISVILLLLFWNLIEFIVDKVSDFLEVFFWK